MYKEFQEAGAELLGCSTDSHFSHMRWVTAEKKKGGLGGLDYPLLSDLTKEVSTNYNCLVTKGKNRGVATRATFIIDGNGVLRHMQQNDLGVGRNIEEILRLVKAFIYTDTYGEVCPSKWKKAGDPTMEADHNSTKTTHFFEKEM